MIGGDLVRHTNIVGALIIREMNTRYGREGLGFAWLILEPLAFCFGVLIMWGLTKPAYEHGIRLAPFVMTGYMSIIMFRHIIAQTFNALQSNAGLLHHRQITPIHVFASRAVLEFMGATAAFIVVYVVLLALGQVSLPEEPLLLYGGWLTLFWVSEGFALTLSGLALRFESIERIVPLTTYALVPLSGAFMMMSWVPAEYRDLFLLIPFPHGIEMIRAGVFGEFVPTYYNPGYALAIGSVMVILGLLLISSGRSRLEND